MDMTVKTTLYYFPNDLFRQRGLRITVRDMEALSQKYGTRITLKPDKVGAIGPLSSILLKALQIDIIKLTIEAEDERAVRESIRAIYDKYGPYEVFRTGESSLAKKMLDELK